MGRERRSFRMVGFSEERLNFESLVDKEVGNEVKEVGGWNKLELQLVTTWFVGWGRLLISSRARFCLARGPVLEKACNIFREFLVHFTVATPDLNPLI